MQLIKLRFNQVNENGKTEELTKLCLVDGSQFDNHTDNYKFGKHEIKRSDIFKYFEYVSEVQLGNKTEGLEHLNILGYEVLHTGPNENAMTAFDEVELAVASAKTSNSNVTTISTSTLEAVLMMASQFNSAMNDLESIRMYAGKMDESQYDELPEELQHHIQSDYSNERFSDASAAVVGFYQSKISFNKNMETQVSFLNKDIIFNN